MTYEEKVAAIIEALSSDANILRVLRAFIQANISPANIDNLMVVLGISNGQ